MHIVTINLGLSFLGWDCIILYLTLQLPFSFLCADMGLMLLIDDLN